MPIVNMHFKDGIFFAKEVGRIDKDDARQWTQTLAELTQQSRTPVVALIDALEVTYISSSARQIFIKSSHLPNFAVSAVAANNIISQQTSRVMGLMAEHNHTHVFPTLEEAYAFAVQVAQEVGAAYSG